MAYMSKMAKDKKNEAGFIFSEPGPQVSSVSKLKSIENIESIDPYTSLTDQTIHKRINI